jgi:hypothetical protein
VGLSLHFLMCLHVEHRDDFAFNIIVPSAWWLCWQHWYQSRMRVVACLRNEHHFHVCCPALTAARVCPESANGWALSWTASVAHSVSELQQQTNRCTRTSPDTTLSLSVSQLALASTSRKEQNSAAECACRFNIRGHRTYWHQYVVNIIASLGAFCEVRWWK